MRRVLTICAIALLALASCSRQGGPAPVVYGNNSAGGSNGQSQGASAGRAGDAVSGVERSASRSSSQRSPSSTAQSGSARSVSQPEPVRPAGVERAPVQTAQVDADPPPTPQDKPRGSVRATISRETLSRAGIHTVKRGETVYALSRRYEVPNRSIIRANDLSPPYTLYVGQEVRIPVPQRHVVQTGDTVYGISRAYGVDMSTLTRVNAIEPPYTISPGQVLVIPGEGQQATQVARQSDTGDSAGTQSRSDSSGTRSAGNAEPDASGPSSGKTASTDGSGKSGTAGKSEPQQTQTARAPATPKEVPQPPARAGGRFQWPLTGRVVADFGPQSDGLHNDGINIAAAEGTPVRAAENGVVAYVGNELKGFGNLLLLKHADNWVTAYAHADEILVSHGQEVRRGQIVARVGRTGSVAEPQLHFEIREGSKAKDPTQLLGSQQAGK